MHIASSSDFVGIVFRCVQSFGFISRNPVLKNITEYLVDEGSYEEEALLGTEDLLAVDCLFPRAYVNLFSFLFIVGRCLAIL